MRLLKIQKYLIGFDNKSLTMQNEILKKSKVLADKFLEFVNVSKSPFHVVQWCRKQLNQNGFQELLQTSNWQLKKGCRYYFTRNSSTIIAFHVGSNFSLKDTGFKIIGAHTDSPCLRLTPVSKASYKSYGQIHVSTYGGGLWHTWFDRDLMLAGKMVYKQGDSYKSKLWQSSHALLKIPNLAIHLLKERNKFQPNQETELRPIISSEVWTNLLNESINQDAKIFGKHNARLINMISKDTEVSAENIIDFDLYFADSMPSGYVGLNGDFISSPRLDNLFSSFHALRALIQSTNEGQFVNITALFDHQECGSQSTQGAGSNIVLQSLQRIYKVLKGNKQQHIDNFDKIMRKSFLISADMAHGIHPNYSDKHQTNHQVQVNKGIVIKTNVNQRYATDLISSSILKIIAEKANVPIQQFIVRNDSPCGSTIGPIIASKAGLKTIDIGAPMLGMHSIRQTCGVLDGLYYRDLFVSFFNNYEKITHDLLDH